MEPREKIRSGAKELFFKYGIKSITMDDLARHLSISKKTLYQFFSDKREIVYTVTDDFLKSQEQTMKELSACSANAPEEMVKISDFLKELFVSLNPIVFFELKKYHSEAWKLYETHRDKCVLGMITDNLKKGIKEGYYRADIDVEVLAKLRLEQVQCAFDQQLFPATKYDLGHVQMQFFDHFVRGITTLKGHKLFNKYKHIHEEE